MLGLWPADLHDGGYSRSSTDLYCPCCLEEPFTLPELVKHLYVAEDGHQSRTVVRSSSSWLLPQSAHTTLTLRLCAEVPAVPQEHARPEGAPAAAHQHAARPSLLPQPVLPASLQGTPACSPGFECFIKLQPICQHTAGTGARTFFLPHPGTAAAVQQDWHLASL